MPVFNVGYDLTDTVISLDEPFFDTTLLLNGGGSLTIDADAYLRNSFSGANGFVAALTTGAWTVTVNGMVEQTGAVTGDGIALVLDDGNTTIKSTVLIGETGVVSAKTTGISAFHTTSVTLSHVTSYLYADDQAAVLHGASSSVSNKGSIKNTSGAPAIEFTGGGNHTVTNFGSIVTDFGPDGFAIQALNATKTTVTNQATGKIFGQVVLGGGNDVITNSGYMDALQLGAGNNTVTNLGAASRVWPDSADRAILAGGGNDVISNAGAIFGYVDLGNGDNRVTGAGMFIGTALVNPTLSFGSGNDTVSVTGLIQGAIALGEGRNMASVSQSGAITGGSGNDTVVVSKAVNGTVDLGGGNNSISGAGSVNGITLGSGNDTVTLTGNVLGPMVLGDGKNVASVGQSGAITGGIGNDTVTASKVVTGNIILGEGVNSFTGASNVLGSITFGSLNDMLSVKGIIFGAVDLGGGNNTASIAELQGKLTGGSGNDVVTLSGLLNGDVDLGGGTNNIKGAGAIIGEILLGSGDDTLAITGKITGNVALGEAVTKNTASITELQGSLIGGSGNDIVTLSKMITGGVDLGGGNNSLTGLGGVGADVIFAGGDDVLSLAGKIAGNVNLGGAVTKNTATVKDIDGMIIGGAHSDIVTLNGTSLGGIGLGDGADKLTLGANGTILFTPDYNFLGGGNDTFIGNGLANAVGDGDGSDSYSLLGGNDVFYAKGAVADGADTVIGGLGNDIYDAGGSTNSVVINLGATLVNDALVGTVDGFKATGNGIDTITEFEHGYGGDKADIIVGTSASNDLIGNGDADKLLGLAGNDYIEAGMGKDHIVGGVGADILSGMAFGGTDSEVDIFYYRSITESTPLPGGRDLISSFEVGTDKLDFSVIDAVVGGTDNKFDWLGKDGLFVDAGDMRYVHTKGSVPLPFGTYSGDLTILSADVNGDRKADFAIAFTGHIDLQTAVNNGDLSL